MTKEELAQKLGERLRSFGESSLAVGKALAHVFLRKRLIGITIVVLWAAITFTLGYNIEGRGAEWCCAMVAGTCAACWIFEVLPLAVTSLLPAILFPLLNVVPASAVATYYFSDTIFVFIGGFVMALSMEKWGLHERLALMIVRIVGVKPRLLLFGVMFAVWFLSMWMSNTATAMAMLPSALAIIENLEENIDPRRVKKFSVGIFLGIAFAAGIGGIATTIGTPPNLSLVKIFNDTYETPTDVLSFSRWFMYGFPTALFFFFICYAFFAVFYCPWKAKLVIQKSVIKQQYDALGPMGLEEKLILTAFITLGVLWMTRSSVPLFFKTLPGWTSLIPHGDESGQIKDGTVALIFAVLMFAIPSTKLIKKNVYGKEVVVRDTIMDWGTATKIPWDLVLLFGGGFALAAGFGSKYSGLDSYLADYLQKLDMLPTPLLVCLVAVMGSFITSFSSNTATANMLLPTMATLSNGIGINPLLMMVPSALSCSFAFMFPYSTPPNVIVFGSGRIRMEQMMLAGAFMNVFGLGVIMLTSYTLLPLVFSFNPLDPVMPSDWTVRST